MLSLANVVHLLAHELTGLRRWRFPFSSVLSRSLDGLCFRHHSSRVTRPEPGESTPCLPTLYLAQFMDQRSPIDTRSRGLEECPNNYSVANLSEGSRQQRDTNHQDGHAARDPESPRARRSRLLQADDELCPRVRVRHKSRQGANRRREQ